MTKINSKFYHIILSLILFLILALPFCAVARDLTEYPKVKLQTLDKITAHTSNFEAKIGDTIKFGSIYMKVQSCQKSSPMDDPESAAFIQVWEFDTGDKAEWIFSGWMFASSPGLSSMNHPIYDVWIIDCVNDDKKTPSSAKIDAIDTTPQ